MAKVQTRRSVSLSREVYEALRVQCERQGVSMSSYVEHLLRERLGAARLHLVHREEIPSATAEATPKRTRRTAVSGVHLF